MILSSNDSILTIFVVGIVAGWLAGQVVRGGSFGLIGDLVVGVIGAFIGDRILPQLHIALGVGMVAQVIDAAIGAIGLLIIIRLVDGGGSRWGRG
jgi:uncharacterized membrane protein YeaQ/YmgE (transglycosylase-associated protein family)